MYFFSHLGYSFSQYASTDAFDIINGLFELSGTINNTLTIISCGKDSIILNAAGKAVVSTAIHNCWVEGNKSKPPLLGPASSSSVPTSTSFAQDETVSGSSP